jgi:UDP-N-acetylmuramate dehydrogenase
LDRHSEQESNGPRLQAGLRNAGFRGRLSPDQPLAPFTSWRIGGPAELVAQPVDANDVVIALRWAAKARLPWRVLGNGSNLLVRDRGVRGLVLRMRRCLENHRAEGPLIISQAGASFPAVARLAAASGLAGLEFAAGIPGTVGGALVMNAGWHEFEIGEHVRWVDFVDASGLLRRLDRAACEFEYRGSVFRRLHGVILECSLRLEPGAAQEIKARMERFAASRKVNQPTELPSCGSVFLKPAGDFAGRLIEAAGLKGAKVGGIEVSPVHANFFVNHGGATACDVIELVERVEAVVERKFGVKLVREFELW